MKAVQASRDVKVSAFASSEDKRAFEVEMNKMLDFGDLYQAMKLIRRFDPALFKQRESMHNKRQIIMDKIHKMQSEDQSSFAKCWDRLRKEQPKLFDRLPEMLAPDQTTVERINEKWGR